MRTLLSILLPIIIAFGVPAAAQDIDKGERLDTTEDDSLLSSQTSDYQYVVYYLHGNRRCATCEKLEAYTVEAIESGFADALEDSLLVLKVVNFDQEENEHLVKDYQLYSQSVILSHLEDGEEIAWKNLDKIWKLVGDHEEFIDYVQSETRAFIEAEESE